VAVNICDICVYQSIFLNFRTYNCILPLLVNKRCLYTDVVGCLVRFRV